MTPLANVQHWVETMVIGLDLCPFAGRAWQDQRVRCVQSAASSPLDLLDELQEELDLLTRAPEIETTLLIHPDALRDFLDFNDFLDSVDALLEAMGLTGVFQVASFHPDYQFAGEHEDSVSNYSNRAPYPVLHLLREASVEAAVAAHPNAEQIPANNISKLESLGLAGIRQLLADDSQGASEPQSPLRESSQSPSEGDS